MVQTFFMNEVLEAMSRSSQFFAIERYIFFIEVSLDGISISRYVSIWGFRPGNM